MKKVICLCLAFCFLCGFMQYSAAELKYTQMEKLLGQLKTSGFTGRITFSLDGESAFGLEKDAWSVLKNSLGGLDIRLTTVKTDGDRETVLYFGDESENEDKGNVPAFSVLNDEKQALLTGDFLGEGHEYYRFPLDGGLAFLMSGEKQEWPDILHVLYAVLNAGETWNTKAETSFSAYSAEIGLWLQQYTSVYLPAGGGTGISFIIPGEDMIDEAIVLLGKLYDDEEMLSLLQEVVSPEQAAAYLNPGMLDAVVRALGDLSVDGEVEILREYDTTGRLVRESLFMPLSAENEISFVKLVSDKTKTENEYDLTVSLRERGILEITAKAEQESVWMGDLNWQAFSGEDEAAYFSASYTLNVEDPADTYDRMQDRGEKRTDIALSLSMSEDSTVRFDDMALSFSIYLFSKSSRRSASNIEIGITARDLVTDSGIEIAFEGAGTSVWAGATIAGVEGDIISLSELDAVDLSALTEGWWINLQTWLNERAAAAFAVAE